MHVTRYMAVMELPTRCWFGEQTIPVGVPTPSTAMARLGRGYCACDDDTSSNIFNPPFSKIHLLGEAPHHYASHACVLLNVWHSSSASFWSSANHHRHEQQQSLVSN